MSPRAHAVDEVRGAAGQLEADNVDVVSLERRFGYAAKATEPATHG